MQVFFSLIHDKFGRSQAKISEILNDEINYVKNGEEQHETQEVPNHKQEEIEEEEDEKKKQDIKEEGSNISGKDLTTLCCLDDDMKKKLNAVNVIKTDGCENVGDCKLCTENNIFSKYTDKKDDLQLLDVSENHQDVRHGTF